MKVFISLLFICLCVTGASCLVCGCGWIPYPAENKCYWIEHTRRNWKSRTDAEIFCQKAGGELATADSIGSYTLIGNNMIVTGRWHHLALTRIGSTRDFLWSNGNVLNDSDPRWGGSSGGSRLCGSMLLSSSSGLYGFRTVRCSKVRPYVCESDPVIGSECTSTAAGAVTMFNSSAASNLPAYDKVTLSASTDKANPCKFSLRAKTGDTGNIVWVAMNVGVHKNINRNRRSYSFNKSPGAVDERGLGIKKRTITPTYSWSHGSTSIEITGNATTGWVLDSPGCGYKMTYRPGGPEPVVTLELCPDFIGDVNNGACGVY